MKTSLLIIDDEEKIASTCARMLQKNGFHVEWTTNPVEGLELLARSKHDVLLTDMRMPELTGIDVLKRAPKISPNTDLLVMTAYANVETAVEVMKLGALDYLSKPLVVDQLRELLDRIGLARQREEIIAPTSPAVPASAKPGSDSRGDAMDTIIASSPSMQEVVARARKVAPTNTTVLLRGESGTGKEVLAKAIQALSPRAAAPFIVVNCGAIPESLMESELFGHLKGSFTGAFESRRGMFEAAHGGTILLDEVGEIPMHLQVKLLRTLQEGEIQKVGETQTHKVDVRVIAATNRNLEQEVATGHFRQDLYYRLNVIPIQLPPLRDRREDMDPLVEFFLQRYSPGPGIKRLSVQTMACIRTYHFPGNIRELENAIEHACVLSDTDTIEVTDLPIQIQQPAFLPTPMQGTAIQAATGGDSASTLETMEIAMIFQALKKTRFNYTRAAQHLGVTRRTLGYRIQKYNLSEQIELLANKAREGR